MIRINLLAAHEIRRKKEHPRLFKGLLLAYVILFLAALSVYWSLGSRVQNLKEEIRALERQTRPFAALQKEIKTLKEKKEAAQIRLTLLQNLEKERHGPIRLMEVLSTTLPVNQLWLTILRENGPEIRIDGMCLSNEILAEYMKRLESSLLFSQLDLVQSTQAVYKDLKVKHFSLIAWTKTPLPPEEKK